MFSRKCGQTSSVVSTLASGARGSRFVPRWQRGKFRRSNTLSPVPFAGMTLDKWIFHWIKFLYIDLRPGRVAQSVTCLATDAYLTADPGVASSIPAWSHTFVEIDHEIISTVFLLPSAESFKKGCCQLQAKVHVHEVLVNCLFKLAQEKVWLGELTVPP